MAGPEELLGALAAAAVLKPNPEGAAVAGAEPKLNPVAALEVEEEGKGVLTAIGKALEVVAAAELAEVAVGKLRERAEAAAGVLDAGEGVSANEGAANAYKVQVVLHLDGHANSVIFDGMCGDLIHHAVHRQMA